MIGFPIFKKGTSNEEVYRVYWALAVTPMRDMGAGTPGW